MYIGKRGEPRRINGRLYQGFGIIADDYGDKRALHALSNILTRLRRRGYDVDEIRKPRVRGVSKAFAGSYTAKTAVLYVPLKTGQRYPHRRRKDARSREVIREIKPSPVELKVG